MAKQSGRDTYVNLAFGDVTESAANTLTFSEIQTSISIFEKVAWVIARIEWYIPAAVYNLMSADSDLIQAAVTASNNLSDLGLDSASVIDLLEVQQEYAGTPANAFYIHNPIVRDFSTLPGGGRIVAPRPLYVGLKMTGAATPGTISARIMFRQFVMTPAEYLELVDFYRIVQ